MNIVNKYCEIYWDIITRMTVLEEWGASFVLLIIPHFVLDPVGFVRLVIHHLWVQARSHWSPGLLGDRGDLEGNG